MNELEVINVDSKYLRNSVESANKIVNEYHTILRELYDCFSSLKDNNIIIGSGSVDVFIESLKKDVVNYDKLCDEIKKHFNCLDLFANDVENSIKRIENDKNIL